MNRLRIFLRLIHPSPAECTTVGQQDKFTWQACRLSFEFHGKLTTMYSRPHRYPFREKRSPRHAVGKTEIVRFGCHESSLIATVCGMSLFLMLAGCSSSLSANNATAVQLFAPASELAPPVMSAPPILLFSGTGTSSNDVAAIEVLLKQSHLGYVRVSSQHLGAMNQSQIRAFRLLIVPGGNFVDMGNSLTAGTIANVRNAVKGGLNYLGICAGGFLAGSLRAPYKSFDLTSGVKFGFYSAEKKDIRKAAVRISAAEGPALDQYWEDGPDLSGWGDTVATYPDGQPAVVEGFSGSGWVILAGIHPEATESWRRGMEFATPASASNAYALTLIDAALIRRRLPHY
jgi:glutamine amidotransferase-like uncharacterized protein